MTQFRNRKAVEYQDLCYRSKALYFSLPGKQGIRTNADG
jgi:hypothetical protein